MTRKALGDFSHSARFDEAYQADMSALTLYDKTKGGFTYYAQLDSNGQPTDGGKQETFADVYAALRGSPTNAFDMRKVLDHFPRVADLIRKKMEELQGE